MEGGWRFDPQSATWARARGGESVPAASSDAPLRLATLNGLHDLELAEVLQHDVRYAAALRELGALDADIIGLNEVTPTFLERLQRETWVRRDYFLSAVLGEACCAQLSTTTRFGNVLLSKTPPLCVEHLGLGPSGWDPTGRGGREAHAATFLVGPSTRLTVVSVSVHLSAAAGGGCSSATHALFCRCTSRPSRC